MGLEGNKKAEGYTVAIPFTKRAKIALYITLALLVIGVAWVAQKGLASLQGKVVKGAEISLLSDHPLEAQEQLGRTWRWALNATTARKYDELGLELLAIESPQKALEGYQPYLDLDLWPEERMKHFSSAMLDALSVAVKAQDWDYLDKSLALFEERFPERLKDSRVLSLQAWQAIRRNEVKKGFSLIQEALEINPYEVEALMLRSRFQARSLSEIEKNQARSTFKKIANGSDVASLEALLLLMVGKDLLLFPEDWEFALSKLRFHPYESIHFSLQNADLLRQLTAVLIYKDLDLCIKYLDRLTAKDEVNASDWVRLAYALQMNGAVERAQAVIVRMESMEANSDLVLWLKGRQAYLLEDWGVALDLLSTGTQGKLAQSFFESLMDFVNEDGESIPNEYRLQAAQHMRGWLTAKLNDWLLIRKNIWEWDNTSHKSILQECREKAAAGDSVSIARFLLGVQEPEAVLELLAEHVVGSEQEAAFGLRFGAFLQLERFDEAAMLIAESKKIDGFSLELAKVQLSFEVDDDVAMERAWRECLLYSDAEGLAGDGYLRMARLAGAYGQSLLAETAFSRQFSKDVDKRGGNVDLWSQYFRITIQNANTEKALKVASFVNEYFPGNREMIFQEAYLNLLLQRGILTAKDSVKVLIAEQPNKVVYQYGLALALLRTELGLDAIGLIAPFGGRDPASLSSLELIVEYACSVEKKGWDEARELRGEIELNRLLPEEAAFILKYEKRMKGVMQ